jgi:hypothetical protein
MSKSWTSPPHAVNLRQFFDNIYNLRLLRNFPVTSRRRSCSRYRKIFPAWKNVKYQYGQGAKCSSTNMGFFHSQACTFPEESFILSSSCNSVRSNAIQLCPQVWNHLARNAFSLRSLLKLTAIFPWPSLAVHWCSALMPVLQPAQCTPETVFLILFRSPGIDSKESIPPAYVGCAGIL